MREFITGNQAVVRAAVRAGCDFVAGYPITPASSILSDMVMALGGGRGIVVQTEDEIAAIGQCIAASMCGARPLTATSGPGLSLYSENIGLAQMVEAPLVIVDCQRMGPSTGGATSTGEGDVLFARHVTAGSYPLPVLASTDPTTAFRLTYRAFQIAEDLRTPVIVLLSKDISQTRQTVELDAVALEPIRPRRAAPADRPYKPYAIDAVADVPGFLPIGGPQRVRVTGSIHDECAVLTIDKQKIDRKLTHLRDKITAAAAQLEDVDADLDPKAKVLVLSYGLPDGAARDAIDLLRAEGVSASRLTVYGIWPIPEAAIRRAIGEQVEHIIVPELNIGLYADEIRRVVPRLLVHSITRYDGGLISPPTIAARVRAALDGSWMTLEGSKAR